MDIKQLIGGAVLALSSVAAFATPQYDDNTFGAEPTSADYATNGAGYYLWNDEAAPSNWHLRWTAIDTDGGPQNVVDWAGSIIFRDSNLGTTSEYLFESGGLYGDALDVTYDNAFLANGDAFSWDAHTNDTGGVDGIDFTIADDVELMLLSLGSSLFDGLTPNLVDPGSVSSNVFIGDTFNSANVLVVENAGMTHQQFEIAVSEPATLALLGLGLAGLGFARRKQAKA